MGGRALFRGGGWQEGRELFGGGDGESGQGFFQPRPGVDAELLAGGREAGEDRQSSAAVVAAKKERCYLS